MYIQGKTLDDLLMRVYERLLKSKNRVSPTRGEATELTGVLLEIGDPRARLSRTEKRGMLFSCVGELLWYLSGTNDLPFIEYYIPKYKDDSEDGKTIYGGYGPRLFNKRGQDQIKNVLSLLKERPASRRAVVQLFDADDIANNHKEIPCTCTLQFMIRRHRLHMFTNMRSNDAYLGLPHDVFTFTMLQEIMARSLNVEVGEYKHAVGSLHLYEKNLADAKEYVGEGWQSKISMPHMPSGDPWEPIDQLLSAESMLRTGGELDLEGTTVKLSSYWADLVRILHIYKYLKVGDKKNVVRTKNSMSSDVYETYIRKKLDKKGIVDKSEGQEELPLSGA